jgi:membrane protease YdiL (CAAX protease family)
MTDTTRAAKDTRSEGLVARRPVLAFLVLALPFAIGLESIVALAAHEVIPGKGWPARIGLDMEEAASFLLVAAIFSTALGVTALADGRAGVAVLLRRLTRWRAPLMWWLIALLAMPTLTVVIAVLLGDRAHVPSFGTFGAELVATGVAFVFANIGEEGTWFGFMQSRLERRHRFLTAAALTALPFALVHMPLRVITGEVTTVGELVGGFLVLAVFSVFFRTYVGVVGRCGSNSILLAAVAHTFFNRSNNEDGIVADILSGSHRQNAALLGVLILVVVLAVATRRRLTRSYRSELELAEARNAVGH